VVDHIRVRAPTFLCTNTMETIRLGSTDVGANDVICTDMHRHRCLIRPSLRCRMLIMVDRLVTCTQTPLLLGISWIGLAYQKLPTHLEDLEICPLSKFLMVEYMVDWHVWHIIQNIDPIFQRHDIRAMLVSFFVQHQTSCYNDFDCMRTIAVPPTRNLGNNYWSTLMSIWDSTTMSLVMSPCPNIRGVMISWDLETSPSRSLV